MRYLVVYAYKRGHEVGTGTSVGCLFDHDPPTATDVIDMQKLISERDGNDLTAITNWLQLSDEDCSAHVQNCYNCFFGGDGDEVDDRGHCWLHNGEPDFKQHDKDIGCDEWKQKEEAT